MRDGAPCFCSDVTAKFNTVSVHAKCYPCKVHTKYL